MDSNKKKIAIISIIVAIIAIVCFVYVKTDIFKSNRDLFFKYLGKTFENESEINYEKLLNSYKKLSNKAYDSTVNFSFDIKSDELDEKTTSLIADSEIIVKEKYDPTSKKEYTNIGYSYKNNEPMQIETLVSENQYALKSDIIYDKYISIENSGLKKLAKKLGMDEESIPDEIKTIDSYELLYIEPNDLKTIEKKYKKIIEDNLTDNNYSVSKNVDVTVNDENIKANSYTLAISEKQINDIGIQLLKTLESDELTLGIIQKKLDLIYESVTVEEDEKMTIDKIKESINDSIKDLESNSESLSDEKNIKITEYVSKGNTVKLVISSEENEVIIDNFDKNDEKIIIFEIKEDGNTLNKYKLNYKKSKNGNSITINGTVTIESEDLEKPLKVNFELTKNGNDDKYELNGFVSFNIEEVNAKLNIQGNFDSTSKVEIDDLTSSNSVKLNDMEEEELQNLFQEIVINVQTRLPNKLKEIGFDESIINEIFGRNSYEMNDSYDMNNYYFEETY